MTAATLAVNVALLSPVPMLTLAGTVTLTLLLSSVTLEALGTAAVRVAVHVEVPGPITVDSEQLNVFN